MTLEEKLLENALTKHLLLNFDQHIEEYSNVIAFFLIFARFEYALKRTRYVSPKKKYAEADWEEFGGKIEREFNKHKCHKLAVAVEYLEKNPPKRQVVKGGELDWADLDYKDKEILRLINAVKQVRNNLFHGGKYPNPIGPVKDPSRDKELIEHSITVLKYLLYSSPEVKEHYFGSLE